MTSQPSRMQWFFLILIAFWCLVAMILPVIAFCVTKSFVSLSFFSTLAPPTFILHRITKYLFPRDERDFQLAAMKIRQNAEKQDNKKRISNKNSSLPL